MKHFEKAKKTVQEMKLISIQLASIGFSVVYPEIQQEKRKKIYIAWKSCRSVDRLFSLPTTDWSSRLTCVHHRNQHSSLLYEKNWKPCRRTQGSAWNEKDKKFLCLYVDRNSEMTRFCQIFNYFTHWISSLVVCKILVCINSTFLWDLFVPQRSLR